MMRISLTYTPLHNSKQESRYSLWLNISLSGSIYYSTFLAYLYMLPVYAIISYTLLMFLRNVRAYGLSLMYTMKCPLVFGPCPYCYCYWSSGSSSSSSILSSRSYRTPSFFSSSQLRIVSSMSNSSVLRLVLLCGRVILYADSSLYYNASQLLSFLITSKLSWRCSRTRGSGFCLLPLTAETNGKSELM